MTETLWYWDSATDAPVSFVGEAVPHDEAWERYSHGREGFKTVDDGVFVGWEGVSVWRSRKEAIEAVIEGSLAKIADLSAEVRKEEERYARLCRLASEEIDDP